MVNMIRYSMTIDVLTMCLVYFGSIFCADHVRVYGFLYLTSTSRLRNTCIPAGACSLLLKLLPCCRAALIRNERVAQAFARAATSELQQQQLPSKSTSAASEFV